MTLTEFLLARIAEDEGSGLFRGHSEALLARVLVECEAKRRIVGLHSQTSTRYEVVGTLRGGDPFVDAGASVRCAACGPIRGAACPTLAALALPYSAHPDCREEWKP